MAKIIQKPLHSDRRGEEGNIAGVRKETMIERLTTGARIDHLDSRAQREAKKRERELLNAVNGAATELNFHRVKETRSHATMAGSVTGKTRFSPLPGHVWDAWEERTQAEAVRLEEALATARRELAAFVSQFPAD